MASVIAGHGGTNAAYRRQNETQHSSRNGVVNVDSRTIWRLRCKKSETSWRYGAMEPAMYEKMLFNKEVVYFIYAPPVTELDQVDKKKRPKKPFNSANDWESSVFYYWWLFLRENDEYRKTCENNGYGSKFALFEDFGNIYETDFITWWKNCGRNLFREPESEGVRLQSKGGDDKNRVNISIPITGDIERSLSEIRSLLQPLLQSNRIVAGPSKAKYPVARKPVLSSLHKIYNIYHASKNNPNMKPAALFEKLKLSTAVQSKESQSSTVSRALKQANFLIEHVGKGIFPVMNDLQLISAQNMLKNRDFLLYRERRIAESALREEAIAREAVREKARKDFFSSN